MIQHVLDVISNYQLNLAAGWGANSLRKTQFSHSNFHSLPVLTCRGVMACVCRHIVEKESIHVQSILYIYMLTLGICLRTLCFPKWVSELTIKKRDLTDEASLKRETVTQSRLQLWVVGFNAWKFRPHTKHDEKSFIWGQVAMQFRQLLSTPVNARDNSCLRCHLHSSGMRHLAPWNDMMLCLLIITK